MNEFLTWPELYQLAKQYYNKGGDGVVECWDENVYKMMGLMTKEQALKMFAADLDIENDMSGW